MGGCSEYNVSDKPESVGETGLESPDIRVEPETWNFGALEVGTSQSMDVTVTNEGDVRLKVGNVRLLALGGVKHGGEGCICPATALVKSLLTHLMLGSEDDLVMDMEAGIEHLGRATTQTMDALLVVIDEGPWSVQTALRVRSLASSSSSSTFNRAP